MKNAMIVLEPGDGPGSSNTCKRMVYRAATREMVVEYRHPAKDGCSIYSYREITPEMWAEASANERPGTWVRRQLANKRWPFDRLRGWVWDAKAGDYVSPEKLEDLTDAEREKLASAAAAWWDERIRSAIKATPRLILTEERILAVVGNILSSCDAWYGMTAEQQERAGATGALILKVDYHAEGSLRAAFELAGVDPDRIDLPRKVCMRVEPRDVIVSDGYGAAWTSIMEEVGNG